MRLVLTTSVNEGEILAKAIPNDKGQILLNEGVKLSGKVLSRLTDLGITFIYIKDSDTDDIYIKNSIPDALRNEAVSAIESTFAKLDNNKNLSNSLIIEKESKQLKGLIQQLLGEIQKKGDLLSLLSNIYIYDNYLFTHSFNVTMYALSIGMELRLSPKQLEILGMGAIMHDVGKMKVPPEILFKSDKLTFEEFELMKKHTEEGFLILKNTASLPLLVAHCAYQHHERMDGSGYPRGLKDKEIHEFGKILAVADVFDAVTSNRVYREALLPHEGLEILYAGSGTLFEKRVVEAFRRAVAIYPLGITVELSDGRCGVVCRQNAGMSDRPIVRILEENGQRVCPYEVDLKRNLSLTIIRCNPTYQKEAVSKF